MRKKGKAGAANVEAKAGTVKAKAAKRKARIRTYDFLNFQYYDLEDNAQEVIYKV